MISGPALLFLVLIIASVALYFFRRLEALAACFASGISALIATMLWRFPLAAPVIIGGRPIMLGSPLGWEELTLQITSSSRALLVFLFAMAAAAFLLAAVAYQGRTFYPFGLLLLGIWAAVAMIQPLTYAPMGLVLAAIVSVFLIQAGKAGETRGAWRQLLFPTLAVPLFLLAAWYMDQAPLNPDDLSPLGIAGWLLIAGFILLLQPAPLHVALPPVAGQAPLVVAAFLWIGTQSTVLYLLQRFLVTYAWLGSTVDSGRWLLWLGVATALLGGTLSALQQRLGRFTGYAALYDYGVVIVAMAIRGTAGLPTAIWLLLTRTFALLTLATGVALIRHYMASDRLDRISGSAARLPWALTAVIVGGFSLVGLPMTAQFASRWALLQLLSEIDSRWSLLLFIGGAGVLVGTLRAARAGFGSLVESPVERESFLAASACVVLVVLSVALGLFPQLLTGPVAAVILPLSTLGS